MTARVFAEQHGCTAPQLHAWAAAARSADPPRPEFAEVRVRDVASESGSPPIEIVVGKLIVRVHAGVDLDQLAAVLGVVARC